jgi:phosphopantetheine--protein transferase-like protein
VGAPDLSFSVSHSRDVVLVAIAMGATVGVDVEVRRPRKYLDRLARRILTDAEYGPWAAQAGADQLESFLRHWTRREAYLKAIGLGLAGGMRDALSGAKDWTFTDIAGLEDAVGTVAVDRHARVTVASWPPVP